MSTHLCTEPDCPRCAWPQPDGTAVYQRFLSATQGPPEPPTLSSVPLTPDEARELSRAAKQVTSWTERRNRLIRERFEAGAGVRELAKATGLNVGTVHTMLHGRKR